MKSEATKPDLERLENKVLSMCRPLDAVMLPKPVKAGGDKIIGVTVTESGRVKMIVDEGEGITDTLSCWCGWPKSMPDAILKQLN